MIGVIATMEIQGGKQDEFEALAKDLMAKVKAKESGCLTYQLYKQPKSEATYVFLEEYSSEEALAAHGKSDYFKQASAAIGACLAARPVIQKLDMIE